MHHLSWCRPILSWRCLSIFFCLDCIFNNASFEVSSQSLEYCSPYLWNITDADSVWTGEVKVLPDLDGTEHPNDFSDIQLTFEPGVVDHVVQANAFVTANLTRSVGYGDLSEPPQCITKYSYTCSPHEIALSPVCNYLDAQTATECGCSADGTICSETSEGSGCYTFNDPEAIHQTCSTPCTEFFWCEHMLISYQPAAFTVIIEAEGINSTDHYNMKLITAGKFDSGCDSTAKSSYALQAYFYSGNHANSYVETKWIIVVSCTGGLLVIFGGGWVIFVVCARPKKKNMTEEEQNQEQVTIESQATKLCEPLMNPIEGSGDKSVLRCSSCGTVVRSKYDIHCNNVRCGKPYVNFRQWTSDRGDIYVPNPRWNPETENNRR